jgi:LuxR family maltose regulon positive regulatory protein
MATETTTPLLTTKLYVPPSRPRLVSRPRLIERLNSGLHRRLTLISAPAGFGKTTLLSEWVAQSDRPVAWLSLDEGDNDLARFLAYLIAALGTIESLGDAMHSIRDALPSALKSAQPRDIESVLTSVINEMATDANPFVLVLDDYYHIRAEPIHQALIFLLDHAPPQMHLIIATRTDPPLPIARLRGHGQLSELRQTDLRFTNDETGQFLNQAMGLKLSPADLMALASRTEGWIAGLQMAAVSMQGHEDISGFVADFTGSQHYILDYLVEEVLHRQPEDVQSFLLQTSILDRMTGPLCDAVTATGNGQAMLESLGHANLFVFPLDDGRHWYRYHHLFADLLRQRLHQQHPDLVPTLHRRASEWYESNGPIAPAIDHSLSMGDHERAARLVEQAAPSSLMRGEFATLNKWMGTLADGVLRSHPLLCACHAMALLAIAAPIDEVESRLNDAAAGDSPDLARGELATLRGLLATFRGDNQRSIELSYEALQLLPEEEVFFRSVAARNLGMVYLLSGDVVAARRIYEEEVRSGEKSGDLVGCLSALQKVCALHLIQGQLRKAEAAYEEALELSTQTRGGPQPIDVKIRAGSADVLRERNELEKASLLLTDAIERLPTQARVWNPVWNMPAYLVLARVRQAQGDAKGAREAMQTAERLAIQYDSTELDDIAVGAYQARLWVAQGDLEATMRWAEQRGLQRDVISGKRKGESSMGSGYHLQELEHNALARLYLAQDRPEDALAVLEPLLPAAEKLGRMGSVMEFLTLQARAFQALGDLERALAALDRALSLAEPEGYIRLFVDEGEPMERLLRHAVSRGTAAGYASKLLDCFDIPRPEGVQDLAYHPPAQPLVEPLSERELEVLRLLNTDLSSTDMAEELIISVNTVRTHIRNIYSKLDVHSRYEAIARAKELNLL